LNGENQIQTTIGHVGIEVSNLSKSKKFYKTLLDGLGFKIIMETNEGIGFSNQNFQVWISQPPKPRIKRKTPTGEEFVVADHLAILVSDRKKWILPKERWRRMDSKHYSLVKNTLNSSQDTMQFHSVTPTII
jgi:catechol 2,3-dioxygenase-like lactoylglutathione lyase family enzyme